jgi:hypothetical protein
MKCFCNYIYIGSENGNSLNGSFASTSNSEASVDDMAGVSGNSMIDEHTPTVSNSYSSDANLPTTSGASDKKVV